MTYHAQSITFVIPGQKQAPKEAMRAVGCTVKESVRVGARRGNGGQVRVSATPGEDVVVLHIANGPTLYLHPESARDLMLAQTGHPKREGKAPAEHEVEVPAQLGWPGLESGAATRGATRGFLGQVWLQAVEVITGFAKDAIADFTVAALTKKLDGRVDPGVYLLEPEKLEPLKGRCPITRETGPTTSKGPILVFLHGTFVETTSTFGKLWEKHSERVRELFNYYGGRVYALDHPTLGVSPIQNAITLAESMPRGAKLHLVTHSRGGVVGEVLARVCGGQGLRQKDLALFSEPKYRQHLEELERLAAVVKDRVTVERMVRVACPARGTLLASKRLDAYLSVLKWGMDLAAVPVVPELLDFLKVVAGHRTCPTELPGLQAMMPDSSVVRWLNSSNEPIAGQLRVVAGDMQGDSVLSWVKTLLSDAFFWTDNDLVVQTRSMYGGTPRAYEDATFALERGGKSSHFTYFTNERTVELITKGLIEERPEEFRPIGPLSWAGEDASGTRAARAVARSHSGAVAAERPAVFVLPGILGSNLALDGERVWLSTRFFNSLDDLSWDTRTAERVTDDGPLGMVYDALVEHLEETHEVFRFGFDWRRPIEDEARRLADAVDAQLTARNKTQQPVRLVAHSMGGIVARTLELERPKVWQRMMEREGARVLMLGTPNGGSWAPMQVLSGDDTFGNALAAFGALFDSHRARQTMAGMPGLLQLQAALLDRSLKLHQQDGWQQLADEDLRRVREHSFWHAVGLQVTAYKWGVPPQSVLDQAVKLRERLDEQISRLGSSVSKLLLVVGHARFTPAMFQMTDSGLEYLDTPEDGDGRVTFESACLPGVATWKVEATHGELPRTRSAFAAYVELLSQGGTDRLARVSTPQGVAHGVRVGDTARLVRSRPSRGVSSTEASGVQADLLDMPQFVDPAAPVMVSAAPTLPVSVVNGSFKFACQPLMLGHYVSSELTGAERTVDRLIGGAMGESLKVGVYPRAAGSQQVFVNTRRDPDQPLRVPQPSVVIVVGLGEEGSLSMAELQRTVCQGVIAYAQRESEQDSGGPVGFELAATLMGSGGSGVSAGGAAQAIAKGVRDANILLAQIQWPRVIHLRFFELYLDRASEAHHALATLNDAHPRDYALTVVVETGIGALPRPPDIGYRGASYDFVTAVQRTCNGDPLIEYTLDSGRARNEVRAQSTQAKLVEELVRVGADSDNTDTQIGRSLFQLLIPTELESFMAGSNAIVLQLEPKTACFPWEMLESSESTTPLEGEQLPWSVRSKVLRKLRTGAFREHPVDAGRNGAILLIGEPETDPTLYAELPNAREEAESVGRVLKTTPLLNPNALQTVNALLEKPYRVVHIAGHGEHHSNGTGGVVLSNGTVLGPREINAMRTVPELVFVNCCHLGRVRTDSKIRRNALGGMRAHFAASVAEQLIQNGVRCVVAAGWAVEDGPAKIFATRFYERLLKGDRFIDAVGSAREAAWRANRLGNTWAAYQCYGDPDWRYVADDGSVGAIIDAPVISVDALKLMLLTAETEAKYQDSSADAKLARLEWVRRLEARYSERWGEGGSVAEAFGRTFAETGDRDAAIRWYKRAMAASDGGASLRATEQYCNLLARRGEKTKDPEKARDAIQEAISLLEDPKPTSTVERECMLGSAYKRLALVEHRSKHQVEASEAVSRMAAHYRNAEMLARKTGADNLFYPAMNCIAAEVYLGCFTKNAVPKLEAERAASIRQSLNDAIERQPDFWSYAGVTELTMLEALAKGELATAHEGILEAYRDLKARIPAPNMWDSVVVQARFTLKAYAKVASGVEATAAKQLFTEIKAFARPIGVD